MTTRHVMSAWLAMTFLCAASVAVFTVLLRAAPPEVVAFALAFAGGGILTNVTTRMIPEGLRDAGAATGIAIAVGFGLSFALVEILGGH
jgi:ZIP family zinc transporter